jgi:hypothetical protein
MFNQEEEELIRFNFTPFSVYYLNSNSFWTIL